MKICHPLPLLLPFLLLLPRISAQPPQPTIGINLSGPDAWNSELPFLDPIRMARPWVSQREGRGWGKGPELDLDENGYIRQLSPGCSADLQLLTNSHAPAGQYTLLYDGKGLFSVQNGPKIISQEPGRVIFDSKGGKIWIRLEQTDALDPARNFRMLMPGIEEKDLEGLWRPEFLTTWKDVKALRFTEYMMTDNSKIKHWEDRPTLDDMSWSMRGVPIEVLCDLANDLQVDAWFNIPHLATDDYVDAFVKTVKERLDPHLKVYIEYSHETYNARFDQRDHMEKMGLELGFAPKGRKWEAGWSYYSYRSAEVMRLCSYVFRDQPDRLVRVLSGMTHNPIVSGRTLEFQESYQHMDALAISPYALLRIDGNRAEKMAEKSAPEILTLLETDGLQLAKQRIKEHHKLAEKHQLSLVAFAGGQLLEAYKGAENNSILTEKIREANRHPKMGEIYQQLFGLWKEHGGELFMLYTSAGRWTKQGCIGIMEFHDDSPLTNPKLSAVLNQAREWGDSMEN